MRWNFVQWRIDGSLVESPKFAVVEQSLERKLHLHNMLYCWRIGNGVHVSVSASERSIESRCCQLPV